MRVLLWIIRVLAVSFNVLVVAVLYEGLLPHGKIWEATFSPRFNRVPFVVRFSIFGLLVLGPILNTVAMFWRRDLRRP